MFYSLQQVKKNIFDTSCIILNEPSTTQKIRFAYSDKSTSWIEKGEDIIYIDLNLIDDSITKYTEDLNVYDGNVEKLINNYSILTRKWSVRWIAYGSNSFENIYKFRTKILNYFVKQKLKEVELAPIPHFISPKRISEEFQGKWLNRWDFEINMYQRSVVSDEIASILQVGDLNIIPNK